MSATVLEQTRAAHEEIERLERCIVQELQRDTKSHKERLHQNHRVNNMRHAVLGATAKLVCFPYPPFSTFCCKQHSCIQDYTPHFPRITTTQRLECLSFQNLKM